MGSERVPESVERQDRHGGLKITHATASGRQPSIGDRILLFFACLPALLVTAGLGAGTYGFRPDTVFESLIRTFALEMFGTFLILIGLGLITAVFAPRWVHRIIAKVTMKAAVLGFVMLIGVMVLVAYISSTGG